MEILQSLIAIIFIILSVCFINTILTNFVDEKLLLLKVSIILITVLLAMYVSDILIFYKTNLLKDETRNEIVSMIRYLLVGVVVFYFYNNNKINN
jgi:hypothetical protein